MNSKLRKTPTRSRRQPTYPSQLEKEHLSNKTYFFKMFKTIAKKHSLTLRKTAKNTQSQPPAAYPSISTWKKTPFQQNIFFQDVHWKRRRVIRHKPFIKRTSLTLKRRVSQKKKGFFKKEEFLSTRNMIKKKSSCSKKKSFFQNKVIKKKEFLSRRNVIKKEEFLSKRKWLKKKSFLKEEGVL